MIWISRGASLGLVLCSLLAAPAGAQPAAPDTAPDSLLDPTPVRAFRTFGAGALSRDLPQPTVRAIHEDREGVIWVLTLGGVARVERGTVEPLAAAPEAPLTGSYFAVVDRPERGVRIAGTGGVYDWDGAAWSRIPAPVTFLALAQHGDGRLIAASALGAVWAYGADRRWVRLTGDADGRVAALAATPDGDVFAGGEDGVRPVGDDRLLPPLAAGGPSAAVAALAADADGALWAGEPVGGVHRRQQPGRLQPRVVPAVPRGGVLRDCAGRAPPGDARRQRPARRDARVTRERPRLDDPA